MSTTTRATRRPLDPPRSTSEGRLRRAALWQLLLPVVLMGLYAPARLLDDDRTPGDLLLWGMLVCLAGLFITQLVEFRQVGAWRTLPVEPGERMLWGTSAAWILPTGGAGHPGSFALSDRRLRYVPGPTARLRGTAPAEWPVARLLSVAVSPVDHRRRLRGGAWVVIEIADADPVTVLTPEPHAVAAELHEQLLRTRAR